MSKKYYRFYFDWSYTPETHWGEPCDDEVVIESYEDGAEVKKGSGVACKNSNGEWETLGSSMM